MQNICEKCPLIDLEFLTNIENTLVYMWVTREKHNRRNLLDYSGVEARASFSKLISDCKVAYL